MTPDSRIDSDLKALAESTTRGLPTTDETARALSQAWTQPTGGRIMQIIRKPMWATTLAALVVAAVLIFPVPYSRTVGYELTARNSAGLTTTLRLAARDPVQAERRAAALRKSGAQVTLTPRTDRVWGSVYAMAKEKLLHIHLELDDKTNEQVAVELSDKLTRAGLNPDAVQVKRTDDGSAWELTAEGPDGRPMTMVHRLSGAEKARTVDIFDKGELDFERDPGMTDDQLRDKIRKQLRARGIGPTLGDHPDVQIDGDGIEIRAEHESTERD